MFANKKIILVLSTIIAVLLMPSCDVENYPTPSYTIPEISTIIKWNCNTVSTSKESINSVKEYNEEGAITNWTEFTENGITATYASYTYDIQLTNIQKEYYNESGNIDSVRNSTLQLNNSGKVIHKTTFDESGNTLVVQKFEYDNYGNVVSKIVENAVGAVQSQINYSYNYNNKGDILSRSHNLQPDGSYQYKDSLIYHNDKQIIEKVSLNSTGIIDSWYKYVYDLEGRIIEEILMNASGDILEYFKYEYKFY